MKKYVLIAMVFAGLSASAQGDMSEVWNTRLEHKIVHKGTGNEGGYSYAASDKQITFFDNKTGKTLWTKAFKELAPKLRKIDELIPFWESKTVFLFEKKAGKDQIACIDMETGKMLWNTQKYQKLTGENIVYIAEEDGFAIALKDELVFVKARTGEEKWNTAKFKGVVGKYVYKDGHMVAVNFVPGGLGAMFSGFKNQIAKINMSNGNVAWEQTYIGRAERKVITKEFIFDLDIEGNMVVLKMNGLQTYDFKTGAKLWAAAFDFTAKVISAPAGSKKFGVYGAVADPIFEGDDVYILDMSNKKSQYLKKYDRNTGKLIWTSAEIKQARAIPAISKSGDKIVLQIGGTVEAQAYIVKTQRNSDGSVTTTTERKVWYPDVKPWGLMAINVADGSAAWRSERFKKGISNSFALDGNVIVTSGKALYSLKVADGSDNYEIALKDDGIGRGEKLEIYKDKAIVIGAKGVSSHNISDGKLVASGKYKKSYKEAYEGDYIIMKTNGADIAAFNLENCVYKQFKARKGAITTLRDNGNFVYVYEKKDVTKLSTK
jgi:outer membrane protein assembly factor BamB